MRSTFRLAAVMSALTVLVACGPKPAPAPAAAAPAASAASAPAAAEVLAQLKEVLAAHRQVIVLFADEKKMAEGERAAADEVGQQIFHDNRARIDRLEAGFEALTAAGDPTPALAPLLDWIESDPSLYDADRLAFRDLLGSLQADVARNSTLAAIKLHKRIGDDVEALDEIQKNYDDEIRQIFSRFETRAIVQKRERWDDYLAHLGKLYTRSQVLKSHGVVVVEPAAASAAETRGRKAPAAKAETGEIFGTGLPPKVVALTFDDGPHAVYTAEITAILKQYGAPGTFFEVGSNLGRIAPDGKPQLGAHADVSRKLLAEGYVVGNHSMTHAQLGKETGEPLRAEVMNTDALLKAVDPNRPPLFRFPYGARNAEGKALLEKANLQSVMWNIDSMDWADPVPNSIADRVMREVGEQGHGIILFHDIHERTVKALPLVMNRLVAEGYRFAGWDGRQFTVMKAGEGGGFAAADAAAPQAAGAASGAASAVAAAVADSTSEGDSWAVVVGIDDYARWPRLGHAVRDAEAVRDLLVTRLGFKPAHVITLQDKAATRAAIMSAFNETLPKAKLKKSDNLFVFFAGHGATRKLSSGRDLGYIIPVDASTDDIGTDAIAMTELQNVSESLVARHAIFVMDACYSGLGLVRGAGAPSGNANFLRDNAHRVGRQMLTAGGADQMVADGGPGGHSIFTWTLLQGLAGKADLNGDNIITGTELAAYVAPAVASVSAQTPAFGSLPGSEGGEFVFAVAASDEYISDRTAQLPVDAIALNSKLDKSTSTAADGVVVKDLQGREQKIAAPAAAPVSDRQQARAANDRGMQLFKEKNYAAAREQFAQAVKLQPDFALAANNLGFVYFKQGDNANAARWFEAALKIDPSRAVAYINLGDALQQQGEAAKARKAFETYLALAPAGPLAAHAKEALAAH